MNLVNTVKKLQQQNIHDQLIQQQNKLHDHHPKTITTTTHELNQLISRSGLNDLNSRQLENKLQPQQHHNKLLDNKFQHTDQNFSKLLLTANQTHQRLHQPLSATPGLQGSIVSPLQTLKRQFAINSLNNAVLQPPMKNVRLDGFRNNEVDVMSDVPEFSLRNNLVSDATRAQPNLLTPNLLQSRLIPDDNQQIELLKSEMSSLKQVQTTLVTQLYQQKQESDHKILLLETRLAEQDNLLRELGKRYDELLMALTANNSELVRH